MRTGSVYTETIVHAAPERLAAAAPYQLAIIDLEAGGRVTARVQGDRVAIGDKVIEAEIADGVPFFKKI
ncbi:MAG: OB-fold domain-containing protein [Acidobacteriota bacterium]